MYNLTYYVSGLFLVLAILNMAAKWPWWGRELINARSLRWSTFLLVVILCGVHAHMYPSIDFLDDIIEKVSHWHGWTFYLFSGLSVLVQFCVIIAALHGSLGLMQQMLRKWK